MNQKSEDEEIIYVITIIVTETVIPIVSKILMLLYRNFHTYYSTKIK